VGLGVEVRVGGLVELVKLGLDFVVDVVGAETWERRERC